MLKGLIIKGAKMERNNIFIDGERVYLRPLVPEDADGNYQYWFNDEKVCALNQHHRFPSYKSSLTEFINNLPNDRSQIVLAVIEKENNTHIGNVSLQNINYINRSAEVASIIAEKTPNGFIYTLEATKLIIKHGFDELNLNRIYCGTPTMHVVIKKIHEILDLKPEGISRQAMFKNGKYLDIQNYSILREEYLNSEVYK